jgi:hypothetical protein
VVGLQNPPAGKYQITLLSGSPAVKRVSEAKDPPAAKVTANVTGKGAKRVLHYKIRKRPAQRVTFTEIDGKQRRVIGSVTGGGSGKLGWQPAPGVKPRKIEAEFELNGLPAERLTVATVFPPSPTLGKPKGLSIRRHGTKLAVRWKRVAGATGYQVVTDTSCAGGQRTLAAKGHSAQVTGIPQYCAGRVHVRALARLREGRPASKSFRATRKAPTALKRLPKPKKLK